MNLPNPRVLKSQAADRLAGTGRDPRRMVLIHIGVILLLNLLTSALSLYLNRQIGSTGGLSGLGTRSVLQTIQTSLYYGSMFFTPFWQASFVFIAIRWATAQTPEPRDLLSGFRRFPSVLSYHLLYLLLIFLVAQAAATVASLIFTMTPWAAPLMALLEPLVSEGALDLAALQTLPMDALLRAYTPMLLITALILIPLMIYLSYRLRLTTCFIMDPSTRCGGLSAMLFSAKAMRGNILSMFRLDLSYWWFYLLEGLLTLVCYLDFLLPALGVKLPIDPTAAYFISLILYSILELCLMLWKKAEVDTTYALAYRTIITSPEHPEA